MTCTIEPISGKILYSSEDGGETGREWFTTTVHSNGDRTIRTLTEMDDRGVLRDATLSVDKDWHPLDCFARVTVDDRFVGTGWFRFSETLAEGEVYLAGGGRISQRWPLDRPRRHLRAARRRPRRLASRPSRSLETRRRTIRWPAPMDLATA